MKKYLVTFVLAAILTVAAGSIASAQGGGNIHYVGFGESLYGIAVKYGVSAHEIMRHNNIVNADLIYVGQPLRIPGHYEGPANYGAAPTAYGCSHHHTVTAGETLSDIAYQYGTTLAALMQHNDLYNRDLVYVGQRLCLPGHAAGYAPQPASYQQGYGHAAGAHYHTVASGETVHIIANRYGVSYRDIMRANNINTAGFIWAGQRLVIPGYKPAPAPPPPAKHYKPEPAHKPSPPPGYAPPPAAHAAPPPAPHYEDDYDDAVTDISGDVPAAPEYQPSPAQPLLPEADHPIEVVVNGGVNWVGEVGEAWPDPNSITTLIVQTGQEYGLTVRIRSGDYEVKGESDRIFLGEFGAHRFVFRHIPPGDYDILIDDPDRPSEVVQASVDAGDRVEVTFKEGVSFSGPTFASPGGWILASWDNPSKPQQNIGGWSNILVNTPASGLWVRIESEGGGYQAKCLTGSKGPGSCDFAGLNAGLYWFWIDGTDLKVKTYMDGNAYATFDLARQPSASSEDKNLVGPVDYGD